MTQTLAFIVTVRLDGQVLRIPTIATSSAEAIMALTEIYGAASMTARPVGVRT